MLLALHCEFQLPSFCQHNPYKIVAPLAISRLNESPPYKVAALDMMTRKEPVCNAIILDHLHGALATQGLRYCTRL